MTATSPPWMVNTATGAAAVVLALLTASAIVGGPGFRDAIAGVGYQFVGPAGRLGAGGDGGDSTSAADRADALARQQLRRIAAAQPDGATSVAVTDLAGGRTFAAGQTTGMRTASVYKLLVLETLLHQQQAALGGEQDDLATDMIENSANEAGYQLYLDAGGCPALRDTARALAMRHTEPACDDPTFTRTSGPDFLRALRALVRPGFLSAPARRYAHDLMANVASDQRWGVGVVADGSTDFVNKNGWLSVDDTNPVGERDGGRWIVASVGVVRADGHVLLMAVFTQHQPSMTDGVKLVERIATVASRAVLAA